MEFWIVEWQMQGVLTVSDTDADRVLRKAAATDAKWLVFSTLGTYFENQTPFLSELKSYLKESDDFFLMGHVLDRKNKWYELHDQCFVMNLDMYRELGCPAYGGPRFGRFEMMKPERAPENFHHDYTPLWVKPSVVFEMYSGLENGHNLLAEGWKADLPIIPFPERLRSSKYQFSPTVRESFARKYYWWETQLQSLDRLFYAFNTESIPGLAPGYEMKPLKRLYTVASGLLFFKIMKKYPYHQGCIVHFYDTSAVGLRIMKEIINSWDGRDYPAFLKRTVPETGQLLNFANAEEKWRQHLEDYGGEEAWFNWFHKVRTECQFRFHEANIFNENMEWVNWLDPDPDPEGGSLFWLSNVFHFRYTSAMRSQEERFQMQKSLLSWLARRNPETFVYLCSAIGPLDTKASQGIFKAADYDVPNHAVPHFWTSRPARYPLAIQHFFNQNLGRRGPIWPVPQEFVDLRLHNLDSTPQDKINAFAEWIEKESHISSLKLTLDIPFKEMFEEARSCEAFFVKHREELNPGWESVCLHGLSPHQTEDFYRYGVDKRETAQSQYKWTEIADRCPVTVKWLRENFPMEKFDRVRFMLLKPGGYIQAHNDMDHQRGLSATNVALNQPEDCEMIFENYGVVPWKEGEVRRLDIGLNHSVYNGSKQDRYHMIIHGRVGNQWDAWCRLTVKSFLKDLNERQNG